MPTRLTLEVHKDALDQAHRVTTERPQAGDLAEGQLQATERLSLTAAHVAHAVLGQRMLYWRLFPPDRGGWGVVPAWGRARALAGHIDARLGPISSWT